MKHGVIKDGVYFKQEKEKDRLRMGGGAWSLNMADVNLSDVNAVVLCTEKAHYIISSTEALMHGFYRTLGGEEKLVVPLKHWEVKEHDTAGKT